VTKPAKPKRIPSRSLVDQIAWMDKAACRGLPVSLFFGVEGERGAIRAVRERRALAVCASCPVRSKCLGWAFERPEKYGVLGGLAEKERAAERRRWMRRRPPGMVA
jgi:WhiB family redox-sensing transcriptional regulator